MELSTIRPKPHSKHAADLNTSADESSGHRVNCEQKECGFPDFYEVRDAALRDPELARLWLHLFDDSDP
jgi:hypothetical protein